MRWTQRHGRQRSPSLSRPAKLTTPGVCATASPYHHPWQSPLPVRCLAEIWLLHPHTMHPIKKRGDEASEEHTERRSELPTDETTGRTTARPPEEPTERSTVRPTDRAATRPTDPITDGAIDPPSERTNDRASGRPHARPLDRAIELLGDRRGGRPSQ